MMILRCTQRILKGTAHPVEAEPPPPDVPLGEWYVNAVPLPFRGRGAVMYTSSTTLLTVLASGRTLRTTLPVFQARLPGLLESLDLPAEWVAPHATAAREVRIARTASRRVLGSMTDLAWLLQGYAERWSSFDDVDLGWLELRLAEPPMSMLDYNPRAAVETLALGAPRPHRTLP
jgi:hypothetical protein